MMSGMTDVSSSDARTNEVEVAQTIAADPVVVYDLVSDVTRMGEWSPETTGCRWLRGATGPAVGAKFKGTNRHLVYRWSTTCTVVDADPGRRFAFTVAWGPVPISRWSYDFRPDGAGCVVTEGWIDRRPSWMRLAGAVSMAIPHRGTHNRAGMEKTLAALKAKAEAMPDPR